MIKIIVGETDFDAGAEIRELSGIGCGAVASFVGLVRSDDNVSALFLEHYPAMADKALREIAEIATARWSLEALTIMHRVGRLSAGDQIVLVCTASRHRGAAFESCAYVMDRLKTDAPFWKKEIRGEDGERWVAERASDMSARDKWDAGG